MSTFRPYGAYDVCCFVNLPIFDPYGVFKDIRRGSARAPNFLTARQLGAHHVFVHAAEAVFVIFIAAHEIELVAAILTTPLQNVAE